MRTLSDDSPMPRPAGARGGWRTSVRGGAVLGMTGQRSPAPLAKPEEFSPDSTSKGPGAGESRANHPTDKVVRYPGYWSSTPAERSNSAENDPPLLNRDVQPLWNLSSWL